MLSAGAVTTATAVDGDSVMTLRTYGATGSGGGSEADGDYVGDRRGTILAYGIMGKTVASTYYGVCR